MRLVRENGVERIVMGFPRNMDGTEGPRADLYREFAAKLEELLGEKSSYGMSGAQRSRRTRSCRKTTTTGKAENTVDAVAASLILEGYLSYLRTHKE